jgi:two-component system, NtrC family, nitrogen regulation sensor histidine kinase GlnL
MSSTRTSLQDSVRDALGAAAFEAGPWPALVFDADGRVLMANEAAERLFGQALASLARRPFPSLLQPGCELAALFAQAQTEGGTARQADVEVALLGAPTIEAEVAFSTLPDQRLLGTFYVESQGARLERASEALRSVAGMGRTLAHEIKNPLAGIRGAAQLLKLGASPADAPLAQVIVDECDRIRRLVDQVEAFSDERETAKRPVNIHRVLDRVRTLVASAFGEVAFFDAYDPSLPHALGDEDQLVQIFLNVAKNAAEAALERGDDRGEVLISTGYRSGARIKAGRQGWRNAPLEVRVQDNGPGVAADLRHRLFDAFVTTKTGGMGLGLTLVAKLVDAHGGLIELESEPGRTVFHILLPVAPSAPEPLGSSSP